MCVCVCRAPQYGSNRNCSQIFQLNFTQINIFPIFRTRCQTICHFHSRRKFKISETESNPVRRFLFLPCRWPCPSSYGVPDLAIGKTGNEIYKLISSCVCRSSAKQKKMNIPHVRLLSRYRVAILQTPFPAATAAPFRSYFNSITLCISS